MTKSTQHRNVPWAPRKEKHTNSTQWSKSVQHPQCTQPFSMENIKNIKPKNYNICMYVFLM